jgi:acetyl esterase/lipase
MTLTVTPTLAQSSGRRGRGPLLLVAAACSLGGAVVYLAVLPALLQASLAYGLLFAAAGLAQVGLAAALLARPTRRRLVGAAAVSSAVVAGWVLARTVELPGPNPWLPLDTAAGFTDAICAALETLATLLLVVAAVRWVRGPRVRHSALVAGASTPPLLLAAVLAAAGAALATDGFTGVTRAGGPLPAHPPAGTMTTVTYCTQHGSRLAMDVYQPPAGAARPAPAVLYVHGGGFVLGDRKPRGLGAALANHAGALLPHLRPLLNQRGFVVASIDYRLPPLSPWPAQLQDTRCAVRFLRAHAGALGLDPGRIGAWGSSGGGTLVSLLGLAGPQAGFDRGPWPDQASGVQAVVAMFGPADLTGLGDSAGFDRAIARAALGSSASVRRSASPLSYVPAGRGAASGPPFLILHGTQDQDMPPRHSQELARRLRAAGVPVQLVLVQGAGHGLNTPSQRPSPGQLVELVADFFTRTLAGPQRRPDRDVVAAQGAGRPRAGGGRRLGGGGGGRDHDRHRRVAGARPPTRRARLWARPDDRRPGAG